MADRQRNELVGIVLMGLGVVALLQNVLRLDNLAGPVALLVVGVALLFAWAARRNVRFLRGGTCVTAVGIYGLLDTLTHLERWGTTVFLGLLGVAFAATHVLDSERPAWARNAALGLVAAAILAGLSQVAGLGERVVMPIALIVLGAWVFMGRGSR